MSAHLIEQRTCKVCSAPGTRISNGSYTKKTSKRWVGLDGTQWNGLVCPDCQRKRAIVNMRNLRERRKSEPSE